MQHIDSPYSFSSDYAKVWYQDGIIYTDLHPVEATLDQVIAHVDQLGEELEDILPGLFIISNNRANKQNSRKNIRDYIAKDPNFVSKVKALAMVTRISGVAKIAANLFINFSKPAYPIKIFHTEEKAIEWLQQYK